MIISLFDETMVEKNSDDVWTLDDIKHVADTDTGEIGLMASHIYDFFTNLKPDYPKPEVPDYSPEVKISGNTYFQSWEFEPIKAKDLERSMLPRIPKELENAIMDVKRKCIKGGYGDYTIRFINLNYRPENWKDRYSSHIVFHGSYKKIPTMYSSDRNFKTLTWS